MCGIAGIAGMQDSRLADGKLGAMLNSLSHRGPDAEGRYSGPQAVLGHRRLSIIDLSEAANQPMSDPTGRYHITFNGEIYNYRSVRNSVQDYPYRTESDTEAILAAYIKLGPHCLSLLNGMFAMAIWDEHEKKLFVARDRLGVKPLYYAHTSDNVFAFASEIRALLNADVVSRTIDKHALADYAMYQSVYSPFTIVDGIRQLPAGTYGYYSADGLQVRPYWRIEDSLGEVVDDDDVAIRKRVKELLLSSVEMRLVSDVRLGAFLSGGIDSSAIVGLMSEVSSEPVETFSVTFAEKEFDESAYSDLVAKRFRTRHTSVQLTSRTFLDELPEALASMDSPSGDGLNTYVVAKATRKAGIKVALSGLGGDELFAGYSNFRVWSKIRSRRLDSVPAFIRKSAGSLISRSGRSKHQRFADMLAAPSHDLADIYPMFRQVLSAKTVRDLCGGNGRTTILKKALEERNAETARFPFLSQFSIGELLGYTQNVLLKDTDQFSMASALEVREPFFDYNLVEYVLRIPDRVKYPKYPKSLLVESLAPMLPDEIVHRRKMGFVIPWERWMQADLHAFCSTRIKALADRGILDGGQVTGLWDAFMSGSRGVLWSHVWHLIVLEDWLQANRF